MQAYWVTFHAHTPGCVEADGGDEAARELAAEITGHEVLTCRTLPYPADPRLNRPINECAGHGVSSFCFKPNQCAGFTACPQRMSCVD